MGAAGARFVADIEPWELRKLWLLNGGHSLLAYLGLLRGHRDGRRGGRRPRARARRSNDFWDLAARQLPHAAELDLDAYRARRSSASPTRGWATRSIQIAGDGLDKLRNRVVPVIAAARAAGEPTEPALTDRARVGALADRGPVPRGETDQNGELLRRGARRRRGDDTMRAGLLRTTGDRMNIASAEVIVTSPSRNFVTLKLTTDEGVVGLGDATLNGRELAVAAYLREHVVPLLLERDAHRIEDTWQYLYRGAYWRRGPVTMAAIGGRRHGAVGHQGQGRRPAALPAARGRLAHRAARLRARVGYLARVAVGVDPRPPRAWLPRDPRADRGARDPLRSTEWPRSRRPPASATTTSRPGAACARSRRTGTAPPTCVTCPKVFEHVRQEFGPELPLLHDVHHRLRPIEAATLGKRLEPYDLFWLEDCTPAENQQGLRLVRQHTTTPLAIGEVFNTVWDFQTLISEQLIDYVRAAATHFGGVTPLRKVMDFAAQYQIRSGFHGPTDVSPVGLAAQLHVGLAIHNFGIQEYMAHSEATNSVFLQNMTLRGRLPAPG